ncbi:hypothetical protein SAMN02745121_06645 [Nannocystis exedens]|uniref:Uncharacterized protein n=1 Tax=Nannocystis exedens TaxID=54 RepID=A0A1I2FH24_9BACT|nr:hypothetical protein [Nannocystis exedens]PCC70447.1 hypothetical protein NAEX_03490 [Nannocystis exedens]SFF04179.1 hypothetical protein SAMN02745121_06645 [Nannocystis exedens]
MALITAPLACGDDKGGETETGGVTAMTVDTTQSTSTTATTTNEATGTTEDETTTTTASPTSTAPPTTSPTATTDDTTTGGGAGQFCQESCAGDADCTINGVDMGYTCQNNRCVDEGAKCSTDEQCNATISGWVVDCAAQAECMAGSACVDIGGGMGKCAIEPNDVVMCATLMMEDVMIDTIEGDMMVTVCGRTGARCEDEVCFDPCEANADCPAQGGHPTCNVGTGKCECASDDDCKGSGIAGYAVCNGGVCGCGQDSDCAGTMYSDKCYDGACGCSSVNACMSDALFDNTMKVCEGA